MPYGTDGCRMQAAAEASDEKKILGGRWDGHCLTGDALPGTLVSDPHRVAIDGNYWYFRRTDRCRHGGRNAIA